MTPPSSHAEVAAARPRAREARRHREADRREPGRCRGARASSRQSEGCYVLAAPFVQLSPTFRALWTLVRRGAVGRVHSARGLYGNAGSPWAAWYHRSGVGPLAEAGIYNLKSLTALLGPIVEVLAAEAVAVPHREAGGTEISQRPIPTSPTSSSATPPGRSRRRLEPGDPALPPTGARAVRRRGHGEPAGRRLGSARRRGLAQRHRVLGGATSRSTPPGSGRTACASASRAVREARATTPAARAGPPPARRRRRRLAPPSDERKP